MGEIKWFKLKTDIFDDEKIKYIETLPESDTILVIWFKILVLAAKSNQDGYVMLTDKIPFTESMLISYLGRKQHVVEMALKTFQELSMIEVTNEEAILISNWSKHQSVDEMKKIKEQNKERQKRFREKKKKGSLELKEEKEKDKESKDIDNRYRAINVTNNVTRNVTQENVPYKEIIQYLNEAIGKNYKHTSRATKDKIKARWNEGFTIEEFKQAIDNAKTFWEEKGELENMHPTTLFNTKFEKRVDNSAYSWNHKKQSNDTNVDWFDDYLSGKE